MAATDLELERALEEMLERYTRTTKVTPQHLRLVDRVEAALERQFRNRREHHSLKRAA